MARGQSTPPPVPSHAVGGAGGQGIPRGRGKKSCTQGLLCKCLVYAYFSMPVWAGRGEGAAPSPWAAPGCGAYPHVLPLWSCGKSPQCPPTHPRLSGKGSPVVLGMGPRSPGSSNQVDPTPLS